MIAVATGGCATVTMVPGDTVAIVEPTAEQSALRTASAEFAETAATRGWISDQGSLFDLARVLVEGRTEQTVSDQDRYAELIGVGVRSGDEVMRSLASDAMDASDALDTVTDIADLLLDTSADAEASRTDLMAFERALVNAQKCRRSFHEAAGQTGLLAPALTASAFAEFDAEIDRARDIADRLADSYAGESRNPVS